MEQPDSTKITEEPEPTTVKRWDWRNTFGSLQNRNYRLFIIGSLVATTALQMQQLAQNYLVYDLTGLASSIGYVSAALGVSMLIFSLVGGIIADRMSKKKLLILGQLGIALVTLLLAVLITTKLIQIWHIVVTSLIIGTMSAFTMPARQSYVPDLVGTDRLTNALALNAGMMNMTRIGGPALAGILIGIFGVGPIYYTKVVAYTIFVILVLFIPVSGKVTILSTRSLFGDAVDGLRYLRKDRIVLELLILAIVPVVLGLPYVNFLPVFQKEVFHLEADALGWMMSAVGGGAVVGALLVASLDTYKYKGRVLMGSGIGFGISLTLFALAADAGSFPLTLVMLALSGATGTGYTALNNALVLTITPPDMRGRVMGVFMTTFGLMPLGALPMGALMDRFGAPHTTCAFGILTLGFFLVATIFRPQMRRL